LANDICGEKEMKIEKKNLYYLLEIPNSYCIYKVSIGKNIITKEDRG
jgi:hypothetical protein